MGEKQFVKRTCDNTACKKELIFSNNPAEQSEADRKEAAKWVGLITYKQHPSGELQVVMGTFCGPECTTMALLLARPTCDAKVS